MGCTAVRPSRRPAPPRGSRGPAGLTLGTRALRGARLRASHLTEHLVVIRQRRPWVRRSCNCHSCSRLATVAIAVRRRRRRRPAWGRGWCVVCPCHVSHRFYHPIQPLRLRGTAARASHRCKIMMSTAVCTWLSRSPRGPHRKNIYKLTYPVSESTALPSPALPSLSAEPAAAAGVTAPQEVRKLVPSGTCSNW